MSTLAANGLSLALAFLVDRLLGEPPARVHPVVLMGRWFSLSRAPWAGRGKAGAFARGTAWWLAGATLVTVLALAASATLGYVAAAGGGMGLVLRIVGVGVLLKPMLAWRMLYREVAAVEARLESGGLEAGRSQLRNLVSRDTARLSEIQVRESALESLAENLNDSLVAPVFYFALGGLPAAVLYRFANTADAMWGYRGHFEWAGKWAAVADDVLSFVPARITAALLALAAPGWPRGAVRTAAATPSPNGGWPMGTLAILLGVRLSKPGVYVLNPQGSEVGAPEFAHGLAICARSAWLCAGIGVAALVTAGSIV